MSKNSKLQNTSIKQGKLRELEAEKFNALLQLEFLKTAIYESCRTR